MSYNVKVLGFGDNVVDKYEHIKTMYPGGNAVNFAVFAKKLGAERSASIEYVKGFDLVHSGNYCFTERELPKIKAAGVPISFDFSDDSTDEYYERIAPLVDYAFMSCGDITKEETYEKLKKVSALGPKFVCASRGDEGCIAFDGNEFYVQGIKPVTNMVDTMAAGDSLLTAFLVSYLAKEKEGKGGPQAIRESLDLAAGFAANTCGLAGSWGHGKVYE